MIAPPTSMSPHPFRVPPAMRIARSLLPNVSLLGIVALLAACSDSPLAPAAPKRPAGRQAPVVVPTASIAPGVYSGTFTVDPAGGGAYLFDGDGVNFPANSICDPALSSYGPSEWDQPCTPLTAPITITVELRVLGPGDVAVDFQPALRFVPSDDPAQWVTLSMRDADLLDLGFSELPPILWQAPDGSWVDESAGDATMATRRLDELTVYRRIKHFSGYMVGSNRGSGGGGGGDSQ